MLILNQSVFYAYDFLRVIRNTRVVGNEYQCLSIMVEIL